jgi:GTPase SAR1 family protein
MLGLGMTAILRREMVTRPEEGSVAGPEQAIAAGVIKLAIERGGRPGLRRLQTALTGRTVMVVGPPRAGKTTFLDYVRYGVFQHAQETAVTYRRNVAKNFTLAVGPQKALTVAIKSAEEIQGQTDPVRLAEEVFERRPHALVIVLDVSAPLDDPNDFRSSARWLREFCQRAEQEAHKHKAKRNRLRGVIVAMNKADLVDDEALSRAADTYREIMVQQWRAARGTRSADPLYRKCIAVETGDHTRWVDAILVDVTKVLAAG